VLDSYQSAVFSISEEPERTVWLRWTAPARGWVWITNKLSESGVAFDLRRLSSPDERLFVGLRFEPPGVEMGAGETLLIGVSNFASLSLDFDLVFDLEIFFRKRKTSFEHWLSKFEGPWPEGESGPGADPDDDGISNLMEFVFSTNPLAETVRSENDPYYFRSERSGQGVFLRWKINPATAYFGDVPLRLCLEQSIDLRQWTAERISIEGEFLVPVGPDGERSKYYRLRVELPE
ncbi:MAG: hypothetical protein AAF514_21015, partial [Verrucomicrobiota bacterium]